MANETVSVRKRVPWLRVAGVLLLVSSTLASAAANMIPFHVPTRRETLRVDQIAMAAARHARIEAALAQGDGCNVDVARALAQDLVFDGRSAVPYADDFAGRCGDDRIVRRWANASLTLRLPRIVLTMVGTRKLRIL